MNNTVYKQCDFCSVEKSIDKMVAIVKPVKEWDCTITGGYCCGSFACKVKIQSPFYCESKGGGHEFQTGR